MLSFSLGQWALLCLLAGAIASLLLNIPMAVQPEGYLPAYIAAGELTGADPTDVSDAVAVALHHGTGIAAALLYGLVVALLSLLPTVVSLSGVPVVPHLIGVVMVTLFIYFFFARVAFPRVRRTYRDSEDEILKQWALSAFIYGVTLGLVVPVLARFV